MLNVRNKGGNMSVDKLISEFSSKQLLYERLIDEVTFTLNQFLPDKSVSPVSIHGRVKAIDSLKEKIGRVNYIDSISDVPDLAGVRVVCLYSQDLEEVIGIIESNFNILEKHDKQEVLGVDKMGYQGWHIIISIKEENTGIRYNSIKDLKCEIQLRTVLQDSWAIISHHLVYKSDDSVPLKIRRDINNTASLLEIAQNVFDNVKIKRERYLENISSENLNKENFLAQPIDFDTLVAYCNWKFSELPISEVWQTRLLSEINPLKYPTLKNLDEDVNRASDAVKAFRGDDPEVFLYSTDILTKTLGFVDKDFRKRHFGRAKSIQLLEKYENLVKEKK